MNNKTDKMDTPKAVHTDMVGHVYNPNTWETKLEAFKFESSLGYMVSSLGYLVRQFQKTNKKKGKTFHIPKSSTVYIVFKYTQHSP